MPRLDITPLTGAIAAVNKSAPKLNSALDDMESKHVALIAATHAYNDSIATASNAITEVTTDINSVRDSADGMLGQSITLPEPVAVPEDLPAELIRARKLTLKK